MSAIKSTVKTLIDFYYRLTWKQFLIWFLFFTIFAAILAQTEIADALSRGEDVEFWEPWLWTYSAVYSYAVICPVILFCCHRWSLEKSHFYGSVLKLLLLYFPFTLVFISLMIGSRHLAYLLIEGRLWENGELVARYLYEFPKTLSVYLAVVFATYSRIYFETWRQEQIHAARLNEQLLSAQITVLRNQLQPHFLFNTLNLISSTMYQDVDKADSIIMRLGDLLRYSLATEQQPWVTFQQEMQAMTSFLEIAQLRFGDRISTKIDIEPQVAAVMIPAMLLQPLLENAVKYGIEPSHEQGEITISACIRQQLLCISIVNPRLDRVAGGGQQASFGIGLKNTKERLELLYGGSACVSLQVQDDHAIALNLDLPIRLASE